MGLRLDAAPDHHRGVSVWIPSAARLTEELPEEARFMLGDTYYNAPNVRESCLVERVLPGKPAG